MAGESPRFARTGVSHALALGLKLLRDLLAAEREATLKRSQLVAVLRQRAAHHDRVSKVWRWRR